MKTVFPFLLILICLLVSACQPQPIQAPAPAASATVPPPPTPLPPTPTAAPTVPANVPNVLWTFSTAGAVWGTPAVSGDVVYIGSDDHHLYALSAASGALIWKFTTGGFVRSQPAVSAGRVIFTSDDGYLYALDVESGQLAWKTSIGNTTDVEKRAQIGNSTSPLGYDYMQSSPVVAAGQVYIGSADGNVYALDAANGEVLWSFDTGAPVRATPAVANGVVYVGSWSKQMYAIDAKTGEERWHTPLSGQVQSTALVVDGMVYTASRKAAVFALEASTGTVAWEYSYGANMWVESSPILDGDTIYIGSSGSQRVTALDRATGKPKSLFFNKMFHWSTPVIVGDTLYIGAENYEKPDQAGLAAIPLLNGQFEPVVKPRWLLTGQETLAAGGGWSGLAGSPVLADSVLYFGMLDGIVYAVGL